MKRTILILSLLVVFIAPHSASAASLTELQIQSILDLLQAFDVPQSTISTVGGILHGQESQNGYAFTAHILGASAAHVSVVTYCDTESPFCKTFTVTMRQIIEMYSYAGKSVSWTYKNFPLQQIFPAAPAEGRVAECTAALGGDFWKALTALQQDTHSPAEAIDQVSYLLSSQSRRNVSLCIDSTAAANLIERDSAAATGAGAQGIPFSVILVDGKKVQDFAGAQPYESVKNTIDAFLR